MCCGNSILQKGLPFSITQNILHSQQKYLRLILAQVMCSYEKVGTEVLSFSQLLDLLEVHSLEEYDIKRAFSLKILIE